MVGWGVIFLLLLLLVSLTGYLIPRERRSVWLRVLPVLAALGTLSFGLIAGWRWQLTDSYLLSAGLLSAAVIGWMSDRGSICPLRTSRRLSLAGVALGILAVLSSAALLALFPDFRLPAPGGHYPVGTTTLQIIDKTRPEIFTASGTDRRQLPLQVWYPAEALPGAPASPYWKTPPFFLNHLARVPTHAYADAPLSSRQTAYPVLLFSHGYSLGYAAQNTALMEELASHGYIVFSIAHPHEALLVSYSDGRRAFANLPHMLGIALEIWGTTRYTHLTSGQNPAEEPVDSRCLIQGPTPLLDESLRTWTIDTTTVIDGLERINAGQAPPARLRGRLDLAKLGVLGMSFGGTTAGLACQSDDRIRAGINLDGPQFSRTPEFSLHQPFMLMYSEATSGMNDFVFEQAQQAAYSVTVRGAYHGDFADYTVMAPLFKRLRMLGPISGERMLEVVNTYVLAFFDKHLQGKSTSLLEGPSPDYPEVLIEVKISPPN